MATMNISDSYRDMVVSEINYIVEKMEDTDDFVQKLYYFSGIHGMLQRIFNLEYHPELIFAFFVFKSTHEALITRYHAIEKGGDSSVLLYEEHVDGLIALSEEFVEKFKNKENFDSTLKKIIVLSFSTTGNGFYLMQKGVLKI